MPRSVNHVASRARRKKIMSLTRGNFGGRANVWTVAKNTWEKGLQYAYRDRKNKKRTFRALWIQRINAAARLEGMSYSQMMGAQESGHRNQPQGTRRFGDEPAEGFQGCGRPGEESDVACWLKVSGMRLRNPKGFATSFVGTADDA